MLFDVKIPGSSVGKPGFILLRTTNVYNEQGLALLGYLKNVSR